MTYPEFTGELYSYDDARRRVPSAWNGRDRICPPGLGHWERYGKRWVYVNPDGYARTVNDQYDKPEPPPLPRPRSEWRRCGCGKSHTCSACGRPYWVEIHGYADGVCTYCYHAG